MLIMALSKRKGQEVHSITVDNSLSRDSIGFGTLRRTMTYDEAIKSLTDSEVKKLDEKLRLLSAHSPLGLQARSNLKLESRLPAEAWTSLFQALLLVDNKATSIKAAISNTFRSWTLHGPEIHPPRPPVFGRAVTIERFCELLITLGYFGTTKSARRAVSSLLLKYPLVPTSMWQRRDLGRFLMWSTFDPDKTKSPFEGLPADADSIRGHLGLPDFERGLPLLLFEFTLPADVTPRYPTVAEAYAGDEWSYYFRPSLNGDPHGHTLPWPTPNGMTPRPEVVHDVIRGDRLVGVRQCR